MIVLTKALARRVYRQPTQLKILQVRWSRRLFRKEMAINVLANGLLLGTADIIVQEIEMHKARSPVPKKRYNWVRTARMVTVGMIQGIPAHVFYSRLEYYLPGRNIRAITLKTVLDQLVASPISIAVFFIFVGLLEGNLNLMDHYRELRSKFWRVYSVDLLIWPAAQAFNFKFVPLRHRVFFITLVSILFDIFLSYAHYDMLETPDSPTVEEQLSESLPCITKEDGSEPDH